MSAYNRQSAWVDGVGGTPVSAARLNAMEVGIGNAARGVLAGQFYNAADQTVTVAAGQVSLSGGSLTATVAANRYTSLNVSLALVGGSGPAAGVSFRIAHYWNGGLRYTESIETSTNWHSHHFKTPPAGLPAGTFAYTVAVQAFGSTVTIGNVSFQATYVWVEDMGG